MAKLKNIETVQKMLRGDSRWQRRTTVGFTDLNAAKERQKTRADGEIWEEKDINGDVTCWWRQEGSTKVKYHRHPELSDEMQRVLQELKSFPNCRHEECKTKKPSRLDMKMRSIHGMCFDCVIEMETEMKIKDPAKFRQYALDKMKNNAIGFFADADKEVEVIKESLGNINYTTSDGETETWSSDNKEALVKRVEEDYQKFKEEILNSFTAGENNAKENPI